MYIVYFKGVHGKYVIGYALSEEIEWLKTSEYITVHSYFIVPGTVEY